jgi:GTPase Era involved in 16S rRNA processing
VKIDHEIYVPKPNIQKMLIGTKGSKIKWILEQSSKEIEEKLKISVVLFLHVKLNNKK